MSESAWQTQVGSDFHGWLKSRRMSVAAFCRLVYEHEDTALEGRFRRIANGQGISNTAENYAWIHCITGLASADPRRVPPKTYGPVIVASDEPRAMPEGDYQNFLRDNQEKIGRILRVLEQEHPAALLPVKIEAQPEPSSLSRSLLDLTLQQIMESMVVHDEHAIAKEVTARVLAAVALSIATNQVDQRVDSVRAIGQCAGELYDLLLPFVSSRYKTSEDRDILKDAVGQVMNKLQEQLDLLTRDQDDREQRLKPSRAQGGVESVPFSAMTIGELMRRFQAPTNQEVSEAIRIELIPKLNPLIARSHPRQVSDPLENISYKAEILSLLLEPFMVPGEAKKREQLSRQVAKVLGRLQNVVCTLFVLEAAQREQHIQTAEDF
ncbi:MAG TPA: hypothetical protein VNG90_05825 [Candidatus Acidoferrum sp.]|nr:hypothetical protein [Candidatus Acidoferrum sp.]